MRNPIHGDPARGDSVVDHVIRRPAGVVHLITEPIARHREPQHERNERQCSKPSQGAGLVQQVGDAGTGDEEPHYGWRLHERDCRKSDYPCEASTDV